MVVMIDGPMIERFIRHKAFEEWADARFNELPNGGDKDSFRSMMAEFLAAVARGIGPMPVIVGVEENSLLMKAEETEREELEGGDSKKKKKKKPLLGMGMGMGMGLCACSPKYLGQD